jgi:hypothetical protein
MRISGLTFPRRLIAGLAIGLAGAILLGAGPPAPGPTPVAVDLGTAAQFAILAGGGIADTGPSVITGDVGTHPLPAISDVIDKEASGAVDRAGPRSRQAQLDLATAYTAVQGLPRGATLSLANDQTIPPGVYAVADAGQSLAPNLTLDGQGAPNAVWILVVAQDLVTAPWSKITLVNGADACNVFWHVGNAATLAAGSTFAGTILAQTSVTVGSGAKITGRLLARTAAVSVAGASISAPVCAQDAEQPAGLQAAIVVLPPSSLTADAVAVRPSGLPPLLPILVLVLLGGAALLGEARHRPRRPTRGW